MTIVPLDQMQHRIPEAGRIRIGDKAGSRPTSIDTFRFTSRDREAIEQIAAAYGGKVTAWSPTKGRSEWQVTTDVAVLAIVLPANALGNSPVYELWSRGGLQRRCDGKVCVTSQATVDGHEPVEVPCICAAQEALACTPTTRLSVLLPDIRFTGTWRLESHGWNAAHELPAMVDMIFQLQQHGNLAHAELAIEQRTDIANNQTKHFNVPVLRIPETLSGILSGESRVRALGTAHAEQPALAVGSTGEERDVPAVASEPRDAVPSSPDSDIVDAEIIDEPLPAPRRIAMQCRELGMTDDDRHAFAYTVSDGRTDRTTELDEPETERLFAVLAKIRRGEVVYAGIHDQRAIVRRPTRETS